MPFPPNVYLIGAQKSGTTFLSNLLGQHPGICVSQPKEAAYFTKNFDKGLDWYRERFANVDAGYLLDATTSYTASPLPGTDANPESSRWWGVPQRMQALCPDARLLYIVRNPISRTYSAYWHSVRAGHESRSFRDAIATDSVYLRTGRYFDQLALYRELFPRERFFVLKFEDLKRDPLGQLDRCLSFLSLSPLESIETERGRNQSFVYGSGLGVINRALAGIGGLNSLARVVNPFLPNGFKSWLIARLSKEIPKMTSADRDYLRRYFHNHNLRLADEYEIDTDGWD